MSHVEPHNDLWGQAFLRAKIKRDRRLADPSMADREFVIQTLVRERDELKEHCARMEALLENTGFPPGHFYSPIVDVKDAQVAREMRERLLAPSPAGVDVDVPRIREMMQLLASHHREFPFPRQPQEPYRFHRDNPYFGAHDASVLFSMLLAFRPKRVVEVGCGYSSCLLLDTNEMFFDGAISLTLIDPFLDELSALFGPKGAPGARLYPQKLQDVSLEIFGELEANDILFIDSSHVSKTGSDVNHYLFRILPSLKPGVLIHVHDIPWPFEYPESWVVEEKRSWNEAYALHAFLQYNASFEILYWNNLVVRHLFEELRSLMPVCVEDGGASLWLRRKG
jgi:Methyltransferase domain